MVYFDSVRNPYTRGRLKTILLHGRSETDVETNSLRKKNHIMIDFLLVMGFRSFLVRVLYAQTCRDEQINQRIRHKPD